MAAQRSSPFIFSTDAAGPSMKDSHFVEIIEEPKAKSKKSSRIESPSYEMWKMRKDDTSRAHKPSWKRAVKERVPFSSEEVAKKLQKLKRKSDGIQIYQGLSPVKQQLVEVLIEDKNAHEADSRAEWSLRHVEISDRKQKSDRTSAMYVIVQRKDVRPISSANQQIKAESTPANVIDLTKRTNAMKLKGKSVPSKVAPKVHNPQQQEDYASAEYYGDQAIRTGGQGWENYRQIPPPPLSPVSPQKAHAFGEPVMPPYSPGERRDHAQPMADLNQEAEMVAFVRMAENVPGPQHNAQQSTASPKQDMHAPWQAGFDWSEIRNQNSGQPFVKDENWSTSGTQSTAPTLDFRQSYSSLSSDGLPYPEWLKTYPHGPHASLGGHDGTGYNNTSTVQVPEKTQHQPPAERNDRPRERKSWRGTPLAQIHQDCPRKSFSPPPQFYQEDHSFSTPNARHHEDRDRDSGQTDEPLLSPVHTGHSRQDSFREHCPECHKRENRYKASPSFSFGFKERNGDAYHLRDRSPERRGWSQSEEIRHEAMGLARAAERLEKERKEKEARDQEVYERGAQGHIFGVVCAAISYFWRTFSGLPGPSSMMQGNRAFKSDISVNELP